MGDLLTTDEAADRLRTNTATLAYWRHVGQGPKYGKVGRRVVYRVADVEAWLAEQFDQVG